MCGFPSIATHLLFVRPIENTTCRWILDILLQTHFYTLPYIYPTGLAAQTASVYLTVVVTIER